MNKKLMIGIVPVMLLITILGTTEGFGGCNYLNSFEKTIDPIEIGSKIDNCLLSY